MNISVIIVTYNCKVFVDYCIQSLLIALKNIESEIIVIDNNSNDQTAEFLKKHGFIDRIVNRKDLKDELVNLLSILLKKNSEVGSGKLNETSEDFKKITTTAS